MAKFDPTPSQKRAIVSRAGTVVVSAGAGSGKTAVLTERILSRLCEDRADIDRFLVVTYTNAAAFEMRERIAAGLSERITQNLNDPSLCEHLRRQVGKLPCAKVQTVHSFCLELVRRNAGILGLSPHFSIGDESVLTELRKTAVDKTLNDAYAAPPEGFWELRRCLCEERGDKKLANAITRVFDRLQSLPYPESWLLEQAERDGGDENALSGSLRECVFMLSSAFESVLNVRNELQASYLEVAEAAGGCFDYLGNFARELNEILLKNDAEGALNYINGYKTVNIRVPKTAPEHAAEFAKDARKTFKTALDDISGLLSLPDGGEDTENAEKCLCRLVLQYGENLRQEKNRAEVVDFNDLEHYAVRLLSDDDGEPTALALELRHYLCELMVDEYQDSNKVQDTIFSLVAPDGGSSFFVGDIKQSIYRFRKADPRIFAEKCKLAQLSPDSEYIAMDTNFRSRGEVLEVCNYFFERSMTESFGDVNYAEPGQPLQAGRESTGALPSELCLLDTPSLKQISDDEGVSTAQAEAEYVAARIKDMLLSNSCFVPCEGGQRLAKASDFAILLSSYAGKAPVFQAALARQGLDAVAEKEEEDPFSTLEGRVIVSLLRVVSNRRQDIPLLSLLRSPLVGMTDGEIAEVRAQSGGGDLWDALCRAAEKGSAGAQNAKTEIEDLCQLAKDMSCGEFLQYVYAVKGAYGVFAALGKKEQRTHTLDTLYQAALNCEKGSFAHVSALVDYIDRRVAAKSAAAPAGEGVRIMSIHKSKGLEFPFVFLCDLCKSFNTDDLKSDVLLHTEKGLALRRADPKNRVRTATKKRFIISRNILREGRAEELRKLYVAMTRAREKLFLVISSGRSTVGSMVTNIFQKAGEFPTEYFIKEQTAASGWLIAVLFSHPGASLLRSYLPAFHYSREGSNGTLICSEVRQVRQPAGSTLPALTADAPVCDFDPAEYLPQSQTKYPYLHLSRLPSKITPSAARDIRDNTQKSVYFAARGSDTRGSDGLTAAEKGTRVHELISRLPTLAPMTAEEVMQTLDGCCTEDAEMISGFLRSGLGAQASRARECLREYQFSVLLTPRELKLGMEDDEYILLNGSIDMLLLNDDGLTVVDFKTDSVKAGREKAAAEVHRDQLEIYALAAQKIFEKKVVKKSVFFLKTGAEQPIADSDGVDFVDEIE